MNFIFLIQIDQDFYQALLIVDVHSNPYPGKRHKTVLALCCVVFTYKSPYPAGDRFNPQLQCL